MHKTPKTRANIGDATPAPPRCPSHVRQPRSRLWQEHPVGGLAIGSWEPRVHATSLCPRASRGGSRPQFPRFWRHQTAPPRHRGNSSGSVESRTARNTATKQGKHGTPGGTRTPDPQVRSLMLYPAELPARAKPQGTQMRAACRGWGRAAEAVSVGLGCSAS